MCFQVGDRVIFIENTYFVQAIASGFILNKEYNILETHLDQFDNTYYILDNDLGLSLKIYNRHIILSPTYKRNNTIEDILK